MNKSQVMGVIGKYGFIECGDIQLFLFFLTSEELDMESLLWVLGKLNECLSNHDNNTSYFSELRGLRNDIMKSVGKI